MVTPAPAQPSQTRHHAEAVAAIAALLLISEDEEQVSTRILVLLRPLRLARDAILAAVGVALTVAVTTISPTAKKAMLQTREAEFYFRAAFIVEAATRISRGLREGRPQEELVAAEKRNFKQHLDAQGRRLATARKVDRLGRTEDTQLGWYAKMDARTSVECRAANGRNFTPGRRPAIGYPGTVHPNCRCEPGPAHRTRKTVYDVPTRKQRRRAA